VIKVKVLEGGIQAIIEDWRGREGYLDKGVAPSGAMDHFAIRAGNLIVGNDLNEAAIEITAGMFCAEFENDAIIAVTGADVSPNINGNRIPLWNSIKVNKGDILSCGSLHKDTLGIRSYIAVAGKINVPLVLNSKSTAVYGGFGGFKGRALKKGDIIEIIEPERELNSLEGRKFSPSLIPEYKREWEIRAIPGPNGAPDYFTEEGMEMFFNNKFITQVFSDRSGIRLTGPKPKWSKDRELLGKHPSNRTWCS